MNNMIHNNIEINEVQNHKSHFSNFYYIHNTITYGELKRLKILLEPTIKRNDQSILNKGLKQGQAFGILTQSCEPNLELPLHYMAYNNILRELIYKKKTYKLPFQKVKI